MERNSRPLDLTAAWHGVRIKRLREKRLLTMQGLCDSIWTLTDDGKGGGVTLTPGAVSRWETGKRRVALRYRRPLADALGTDHELLFENPPTGWRPPTAKQEAAA